MCVLEIAGDQRAEALLASGVPELEAVVLSTVSEVLGEEVDADGGLGEGGVHWRFHRSDRGCISRLDLIFPLLDHQGKRSLLWFCQ